MVPTVLFPLGTPSTVQVTVLATLAAQLVTVAVNGFGVLSVTLAEVGVTPTLSGVTVTSTWAVTESPAGLETVRV